MCSLTFSIIVEISSLMRNLIINIWGGYLKNVCIKTDLNTIISSIGPHLKRVNLQVELQCQLKIRKKMFKKRFIIRVHNKIQIYNKSEHRDNQLREQGLKGLEVLQFKHQAWLMVVLIQNRSLNNHLNSQRIPPDFWKIHLKIITLMPHPLIYITSLQISGLLFQV